MKVKLILLEEFPFIKPIQAWLDKHPDIEIHFISQVGESAILIFYKDPL